MKILNKLAIIFFIVLIVISGCSPKNNSETVELPSAYEGQTPSGQNEKNTTNKIQVGEINQSEKETKDEKLKTDEKKETGNLKETNETIKDNVQQITNEIKNTENNTIEDISNISNNNIDNTINLEENKEKQTNEVSFTIEGNVKNELQLTLRDLKSMDDIFFEADFFALNSFGTKAYFHFKGVKLWNLLKEKAEISEDATSITILAEDGYKMLFTLEQVKKQDYIDEQNKDMLYPMIIAWEENNVEYDDSEGAPFKIVVGQKEAGDVNKPQWVSNISKIIIE